MAHKCSHCAFIEKSLPKKNQICLVTFHETCVILPIVYKASSQTNKINGLKRAKTLKLKF